MSGYDPEGPNAAEGMYRSSVTPDRTLMTILRVAGGVGIVSVLLVPLVNNSETGSQKMFEIISGLIISLAILTSSFLLKVTAKVTNDQVILKCARIFKGTIPLAEIDRTADDSNFPAVGYGYRILGKNHRGFIMGGPQATLVLRDGRQYTVSVESVDAFCSAVNKAVEKLDK